MRHEEKECLVRLLRRLDLTADRPVGSGRHVQCIELRLDLGEELGRAEPRVQARDRHGALEVDVSDRMWGELAGEIRDLEEPRTGPRTGQFT